MTLDPRLANPNVLTPNYEFYRPVKRPSADNWYWCSGSSNLIEKLKRERKIPLVKPGTKFTSEGTVAHTVGDNSLSLLVDPRTFLGDKHEVEGFKFTVTEEMVLAVTVYVNYVRELVDDLVFSGADVEFHVEVFSDLSSLGIPGLTGGTCDCLIVDFTNKVIYVIDYKHGKGVAVEVEDNTQTSQYGFGQGLKLDIDSDWSIEMVIVQPRAIHPDGPIRRWRVSANKMALWAANELVPRAKACEEPDAPLTPHLKGCRWCEAEGNCEAANKNTQQIAMVDFDDFADKAPLPKVSQMSAEHKRAVVVHAEALRGFIASVEAQVKYEVDQGSVDYRDTHKLVRKVTHRKFTDRAKDPIFSPLLSELEYGDVYQDQMKTLTDIEGALVKKVGKKKAGELMSEATTKATGDTALATIGDKRKEVTPAIQSDFAHCADTHPDDEWDF